MKKNKTRSTFNTKNLHTRINIYIFARMKLFNHKTHYEYETNTYNRTNNY